MFKKYYKAANDDIKPKRELIDTIFEKADKEAVRTKRFSFRPAYSVAAAAVLMVVVSFAAYPMIKRSEEVTVPPQVISDNTRVSKNEYKPEKNKENEAYYTEKATQTPQAKQGEAAKKGDEQTEAKKPDKAALNTVTAAPQAENTAEGSENSASEHETKLGDDAEYLKVEPDGAEVTVHYASEGRSIAEKAIISERRISAEEIVELSEDEKCEVVEEICALPQFSGDSTGDDCELEIMGSAEISESKVYIAASCKKTDEGGETVKHYILTADLSELYECVTDENGGFVWNTELNLLK